MEEHKEQVKLPIDIPPGDIVIGHGAEAVYYYSIFFNWSLSFRL